MSATKLLLGLASAVMGLQGLKSGLGDISEAAREGSKPRRPPRRLAGLGDATAAIQPTPVGRPRSINALPHTQEIRSNMRKKKIKTLDERLYWIQTCVKNGFNDPKMYALAREITSQQDRPGHFLIDPKDNVAEAKAIFEYVQAAIRYTSDPLGRDTFASPRLALKLKAGDCDDYSAVICTLLLQVGIGCKLKVIDTKDSPDWSHIYACAMLPRSAPTHLVPMDASVRKAAFGWEAPKESVDRARLFDPLPGN